MTSFRFGIAAAFVVLASGCALMGEFTPSDSLIGDWMVDEIDSEVVSGAPVAITFDETSRISGSAGCNRFTGAYSYDAAAGTLTVTPLGATRMMCAPAVMQQERRLIQSLQAATTVETTADGATVLKSETSRIQMRRRSAAPQTAATKAAKPPRAPVATVQRPTTPVAPQPAPSNPYGVSSPTPAATPPVYTPPAAATPPLDASTQVSASGQLFFAEAVTLPPGATVRIQLRDVARIGVPPLVLAQQEFAAGAGGPYPFSISAPANVVPANARLTLVAQILSGGRLLYINDANNPVASVGASPAMSVRLASAAPGARPAAPVPAPTPTTTAPPSPAPVFSPPPAPTASTPTLAGGPGAFTAPAPTAYRCGAEDVRVAFDASMAWMTTPDGVLAVPRVNPSDDPFAQRMYSNNRFTFIQDQGANPRVQFSRGRMALVTCSKAG